MNKRSAAVLDNEEDSEGPPLKWDKKSEDAKELRKLLTNGTINPGATPKEIHQLRPQFKKYPLDKFRNGLYAMKIETGFNLRHPAGVMSEGKLKVSILVIKRSSITLSLVLTYVWVV